VNKLISVLLIFLFFFCIPHLALAQKTEYEFASIEGLAEQEIARIVLPQIYQKMGETISITPLPANRAQYEANEGIKAGETLRIFSYGIENINLIRIPTPYYYLYTAAFSLKSNQVIVIDKNDLKKYKVGKVSSVKHTENITKGLNKVYNSNSTESLFQQLLLGNIDLALTNLSNGELMSQKSKFLEIQVVNPSLDKLNLFHYVHKSHQELVKPINLTIKQLQANGELAKMLAQAEEKILK
jgi:polar amino acid transport system substrate-binding protein